jgi:hypothetical protein
MKGSAGVSQGPPVGAARRRAYIARMTPALAPILEGYLELRRQMDPVAATAAGDHALDDRFAAWDRASVREMAAAVRSYASSLEEAEADTLDDEIDRTAALHAARHDLIVLEQERPFAHNPAFHLSHLVQGLGRLAATLDEDAPARSAALLARLRAVPELVAGAREALTDPAPLFVEEAGEMLPAALALVRDELAALPLDPGAVDPAEWEGACAAAADALVELGDWLALAEENAGGSAAIGRALYERKLRTAHMIQMGADELARLGERVRAAADEEGARAAEALEPGSEWRALAARLRAGSAEHRGAVGACAASMTAAVAAQERPVRRAIGTPAARDGWALYCEEVVTGSGAMASPAHRLLTAQSALRSAELLLADVGLHAHGRSPEETRRALAAALGLGDEEALALVRRVAAAPTMLAGAAVGHRDIVRLRDDARAARGATWSAPEFHRELLSYAALPTALARWGMGIA